MVTTLKEVVKTLKLEQEKCIACDLWIGNGDIVNHATRIALFCDDAIAVRYDMTFNDPYDQTRARNGSLIIGDADSVIMAETEKEARVDAEKLLGELYSHEGDLYEEIAKDLVKLSESADCIIDKILQLTESGKDSLWKRVDNEHVIIVAELMRYFGYKRVPSYVNQVVRELCRIVKENSLSFNHGDRNQRKTVINLSHVESVVFDRDSFSKKGMADLVMDSDKCFRIMEEKNEVLYHTLELLYSQEPTLIPE